jgi:hypothetical protein
MSLASYKETAYLSRPLCCSNKQFQHLGGGSVYCVPHNTTTRTQAWKHAANTSQGCPLEVMWSLHPEKRRYRNVSLYGTAIRMFTANTGYTNCAQKSLGWSGHSQLFYFDTYTRNCRLPTPSVLCDCGGGDRGSIPSIRKRVFFSAAASRPALWPTQPPIQRIPGSLPEGKRRPKPDAVHSPHLVTKSINPSGRALLL